MPEIIVIAAIDQKRGLARKGRIPWDLPADRQQFREKIAGKIIVFGHGTYGDIKPLLKNGRAYMVSRERSQVEGAVTINDLPAFLNDSVEDVWVVGGGGVFSAALPFATKLLLTRVEGNFDCDVFLPEFEEEFELAEKSAPHDENGIGFRYETWVPKPK